MMSSGAPAPLNGTGKLPMRPSPRPRTSERRGSRPAGSKRPDLRAADRPVQLSLMLVVPPIRSRAEPLAEPKRPPVVERFAGMDTRMSTSDVVRVVGVNRSTLFRWCKKGIFPSKHISGGWLRSDIEKWFATKTEQRR